MTFLPELLAPAGTREQLESALLYGADAVYLGGGALSLRAGRPFQGEALRQALQLCRAHKVKLYYCLNAFPRQQHWKEVEESLELLGQLQPDALIIADAGVFHEARRRCPHLPIHLSTQANTGNARSAAFWADQGASRVNLARELPLGQIAQIRKALRSSQPALEVECFVHGALCLALSGQCLLSAWLQDRPANEGLCTQPCRYKYRRASGSPTLHSPKFPPESVLLEEALRPGQPIWEVTQHWQGQEKLEGLEESGLNGLKGLDGLDGLGEQGDYAAVWSPEDLCLIRFLPWFARMGVDSLKIEGRMRTGAYVAHSVDAYRTALDNLGQPQKAYVYKHLEEELRNTATRALSSGFFLPRRQCRPSAGANARQDAALPAASVTHVLPLLARVEEMRGQPGQMAQTGQPGQMAQTGQPGQMAQAGQTDQTIQTGQAWTVSVRGRWDASQPITLVLPHMQRPVLQAGDYRLENAKGEAVNLVHSGTKAVLHCHKELHLPQGVYIRACQA